MGRDKGASRERIEKGWVAAEIESSLASALPQPDTVAPAFEQVGIVLCATVDLERGHGEPSRFIYRPLRLTASAISWVVIHERGDRSFRIAMISSWRVIGIGSSTLSGAEGSSDSAAVLVSDFPCCRIHGGRAPVMPSRLLPTGPLRLAKGYGRSGQGANGAFGQRRPRRTPPRPAVGPAWHGMCCPVHPHLSVEDLQ